MRFRILALASAAFLAAAANAHATTVSATVGSPGFIFDHFADFSGVPGVLFGSYTENGLTFTNNSDKPAGFPDFTGTRGLATDHNLSPVSSAPGAIDVSCAACLMTDWAFDVQQFGTTSADGLTLFYQWTDTDGNTGTGSIAGIADGRFETITFGAVGGLIDRFDYQVSFTSTQSGFDPHGSGGDFSVIDNFGTHATNRPMPPAGGIPEPASWSLMILGFGAAGAMLRRRKLSAA